MLQSFLIIWQLGSNEQSRTETPIDVIFVSGMSAEEK